jgi:hypothetical protein
VGKCIAVVVNVNSLLYDIPSQLNEKSIAGKILDLYENVSLKKFTYA